MVAGAAVVTVRSDHRRYDPFEAAAWDDPFPTYAWLRDEQPVYRVEGEGPGHGLWVLSRFEDVQAAAGDWATFSSEQGISLGGIDTTKGVPPNLLTLDPPRHDELRKLVSRAFTPRTVSDLEPRVREVARDLLDASAPDGPDGERDLMDLAAALPTIVIAELLGVPSEDRQAFREWVEDVVTLDPVELAGKDGAGPKIFELYAYLQACIDQRAAEPRDDLVSRLLHAEVDGERLSGPEVLGFTLVLLAAGFETTKNLVGNAAWVLHDHPEARARLVADPSLVPTAVEEVLRYESPVIGLARTTTRDVEVRGVVIPRGAKVQLNYASANRDDRAFVDAHRFDLDRTDQRHLAFGHGIHFCLGAALARLEARVALEELLQRHPTYEVVRRERLPSAYVRGFTSLVLATGP